MHSPAISLHASALLLTVICTATAPAQTFQNTPDTHKKSNTTTLSTVEVVGDTAAPMTWHAGPSTGAKTELPVRELPQSVRIITRQTIDDLSANKLDLVLDYVSGISRNNNFGDLQDGVMIRGLPSGSGNFGADALLNGFSSSRGYPLPRDLAGVERVEFLKGPSAALYGSSSPGGTLNIVSKRPLWQAAHGASTAFGSHDYKRIAVDSSAPLSQNLAWRMNVAVEEGGSFREHVNPQRRVFAPALTWNLGQDTVLEYAGEVIYHKTPMDRGVVAVNGRLGAVPRERFLGEPGDGNLDLNNKTHQFILTHPLGAQWDMRLGASYRETKLLGYLTAARALRANGDLTRGREYLDFRSEDISAQAEVQGTFQAGSMEHEVLLGLEGYQFDKDDFFLLSGNDDYAINIYNPVYGLGFPTLEPWRDSFERQRNTAVYAQDVIKLAQDWRMIAGVRFDRYHQRLFSHVASGSVANSTIRNKTSATSPRIGISWLPSSQITVYASAGKSFMPNGGQDFYGNRFKPETGRALETGIKWESTERDLGMSFAIFDIQKRNILTLDPSNPGFSINAGEVRSQGIEWDISGQVGEHWRLNASAGYAEAEVHKDNTLQVGARISNSPHVTGSALAIYESNLPGGQRYSVGGGLVHVGRRLGQVRTQADVNAGHPGYYMPAYSIAKLVGSFDFNDKIRLLLNVDNLFDKTYYVSSYSAVWTMPGASRMVSLELQATF